MKHFKLSVQTLLCAVLLLGSGAGLVQSWMKLRESVFKVDGGKPTRAAISSDGKKIAVYYDGIRMRWDTFRLFEFNSENEYLKELPVESNKTDFMILRFSPDDSRLYTNGHKYTGVTRINDGASLFHLPGWEIGRSENGEYIISVIYETKTVILYETAGGREICRFPAPADPSHLEAFVSNNGKYMIVVGEDGMRLRDSKGAEIAVLDSSKDGAYFIDLSPDGKRVLASMRNNGVHCWDIERREKLFTINKGTPSRGVFSADSTQISTTKESSMEIEVWDATTGVALRRMGPFTDHPWMWRDSKRGLFSISRFYSDELWNVNDGKLGEMNGWHNSFPPVVTRDLNLLVTQRRDTMPLPVLFFESGDADLWVRNDAKTEWNRWRPAQRNWARRFFIFFTLLMLALLVRSVRRDRAAWRAAAAANAGALEVKTV